MAKKAPDFIAMACTTASVSYRESLTPDELVQALLSGKVPRNRQAHFHVLLDETPVALLRGLIEQVGKQATHAEVAENFQRIAAELGSCRDLSTLQSPVR
jgi:DNA polymerase III delta subunit